MNKNMQVAIICVLFAVVMGVLSAALPAPLPVRFAFIAVALIDLAFGTIFVLKELRAMGRK